VVPTCGGASEIASYIPLRSRLRPYRLHPRLLAQNLKVLRWHGSVFLRVRSSLPWLFSHVDVVASYRTHMTARCSRREVGAQLAIGKESSAAPLFSLGRIEGSSLPGQMARQLICRTPDDLEKRDRNHELPIVVFALYRFSKFEILRFSVSFIAVRDRSRLGQGRADKNILQHHLDSSRITPAQPDTYVPFTTSNPCCT
jgi:hypothetical protein